LFGGERNGSYLAETRLFPTAIAVAEYNIAKLRSMESQWQ